VLIASKKPFMRIWWRSIIWIPRFSLCPFHNSEKWISWTCLWLFSSLLDCTTSRQQLRRQSLWCLWDFSIPKGLSSLLPTLHKQTRKKEEGRRGRREKKKRREIERERGREKEEGLGKGRETRPTRPTKQTAPGGRVSLPGSRSDLRGAQRAGCAPFGHPGKKNPPCLPRHPCSPKGPPDRRPPHGSGAQLVARSDRPGAGWGRAVSFYNGQAGFFLELLRLQYSFGMLLFFFFFFSFPFLSFPFFSLSFLYLVFLLRPLSFFLSLFKNVKKERKKEIWKPVPELKINVGTRSFSPPLPPSQALPLSDCPAEPSRGPLGSLAAGLGSILSLDPSAFMGALCLME